MVIQLCRAPSNNIETIPRRIERKYYITPRETGLAYGLLRQISLPTTEYFAEQINSLYFDTIDLDEYEGSISGDYQKNKIRIRWYGENEDLNVTQPVFIELKSRHGFSGTKQRLRTGVLTENLSPHNLKKGIVKRTALLDTLAGFGYFPLKMLEPIVVISYWRYRFYEIMTGQQLSLDCHIRSTMMVPGKGNGERELELPGSVIEIKGQSLELPLALRQAHILGTNWTRFSKYSACIDSHNENPGTVGRLSPSGKIISY